MRKPAFVLAGIAAIGLVLVLLALTFGVGPFGGRSSSPAEDAQDEPIPQAITDGQDGNIVVIEVAGQASGLIEIELLADVAPQHVARIKQLARSGAYDGVVFHRVIKGFMAQTGDVQFGRREGFDPSKAGRGASDLPDLPAEFSDVGFETGIVGMARSQSPDSANSQFFIMLDAGRFLDGQYTVLGRVIAGQDVVNAIKLGNDARNGAVDDPDYMARVTIKADQ